MTQADSNTTNPSSASSKAAPIYVLRLDQEQTEVLLAVVTEARDVLDHVHERNVDLAEAKARRGDFSYAERWLATGAHQGAGVLQSIKELLDHCQPDTGRAAS